MSVYEAILFFGVFVYLSYLGLTLSIASGDGVLMVVSISGGACMTLLIILCLVRLVRDWVHKIKRG